MGWKDESKSKPLYSLQLLIANYLYVRERLIYVVLYERKDFSNVAVRCPPPRLA